MLAFCFLFFVSNLTDEQLILYKSDPDNFTVEGNKLEPGDIRIKYTLAATGLQENLADMYEADSQNGILVLLNVCADSSMKDEGTAREIINRVQRLRKEAKLVPSDPVRVYYRLLPLQTTIENENKRQVTKVDLARVCTEFHEYIQNSLKADFIDLNGSQSVPSKFLIQAINDIKSESIELAIERLEI